MSHTVFIPFSDEMLENALREGLPQLIPYAYQQRCHRGLLNKTTADPAFSQSAPGLSARRVEDA